MIEERQNELGDLLKRWRTRLNPDTLGVPLKRRKTPGLRREEVAERARVSATWYTWLEQGRGGAPSREALSRIAEVLGLSRAEREYLFQVAQLHAPQPKYDSWRTVTPQVQRVLDMLEVSPAFIRTAAYDLIAWNRAATVTFADYDRLPPERRNFLKRLFCEESVRRRMPDTWTDYARFEVANFRAEAVRHGNSGRIQQVIAELSQESEAFRSIWSEHEVSDHGEGSKVLFHPKLGELTLAYSAFHIDGQPDLTMVVYVAPPDQGEGIRRLCQQNSRL